MNSLKKLEAKGRITKKDIVYFRKAYEAHSFDTHESSVENFMCTMSKSLSVEGYMQTRDFTGALEYYFNGFTVEVMMGGTPRKLDWSYSRKKLRLKFLDTAIDKIGRKRPKIGKETDILFREVVKELSKDKTLMQ
jgi:hypothetical protein